MKQLYNGGVYSLSNSWNHLYMLTFLQHFLADTAEKFKPQSAV